MDVLTVNAATAFMLKRVFVHNFRCLENFTLPVGDKASALLIGKNGAGKSTVSFAFTVLQKVARGTNRVKQLITAKDCVRTDEPVRFEIEVELEGELYQYGLAFELPPGFRELRVLSENLARAGVPIYTREQAKVMVSLSGADQTVGFPIDWHLVALPIVQGSTDEPVSVFKRWLARSVILAPVPALITGESDGETLEPDRNGQNLGAWFAGLIANYPAAYATMDSYLKELLNDFWDVQNPSAGAEKRNLLVQFRDGASSVKLPFSALSDGEKCFFLSALVLAANKAYGPLLCFWDEPDSHLSLDELGHLVTALRRSFENEGGQLLVTSHSAETIRRFSDENTLLLSRKSHMEPTRVRTLEEIGVNGDPIAALIRGDLDP